MLFPIKIEDSLRILIKKVINFQNDEAIKFFDYD